MSLFGLFQTSPLILAFVGLAAYLLGSVSFGLIVSNLFGLADPRSIGSGNIGANGPVFEMVCKTVQSLEKGNRGRMGKAGRKHDHDLEG